MSSESEDVVIRARRAAKLLTGESPFRFFPEESRLMHNNPWGVTFTPKTKAVDRLFNRISQQSKNRKKQ